MPFQSEDRTDVWSIGEIDGVWGLNRDAAILVAIVEIENVVWVMMLSIAMISPMVL